jgi:hypothetical protein
MHFVKKKYIDKVEYTIYQKVIVDCGFTFYGFRGSRNLWFILYILKNEHFKNNFDILYKKYGPLID